MKKIITILISLLLIALIFNSCSKGLSSESPIRTNYNDSKNDRNSKTVDSLSMLVEQLKNEVKVLQDNERRLFVPDKIELYELVKLLTPSKKDGVTDWHIAAEKNSVISWKTKGAPDYREGEVTVTLNNKFAECLEYYVEPCKWSVKLSGSHSGYNSFSINSVANADYQAYNIEDLFFVKAGEKKYTYELLKECTEMASWGYYFYKIDIPGKDTIWMKYEYSGGSGGNAISLSFYTHFDKYKIDLECI